MKYKKQIKFFNKYVKYYQKKLNLLNWDIHILSQDKPGARASAYWTFYNKTCSICWSESWIEKNPSKKEIKKVAFHEICEIFLSEITDKLNRYYSENITEGIIHNIIRTLENTLLKTYK